MNKKLSTLALTAVLFLSVTCFAGDDDNDGTTHSGGKSCPTGTTCLNQRPENTENEKSDDFFKDVIDYLKALFG